jgi:hypothetical protein
MADPKDNAKMTGDTHLPDVESEFNIEERNAQAAGSGGTQEGASGGQDGPGRGGKKAGELKDKDAETSNSYGNTRDSGDNPGQ